MSFVALYWLSVRRRHPCEVVTRSDAKHQRKSWRVPRRQVIPDSRRVRAKLLGVLDIVSVFHYYHILQRIRQVTNGMQMMSTWIS